MSRKEKKIQIAINQLYNYCNILLGLFIILVIILIGLFGILFYIIL